MCVCVCVGVWKRECVCGWRTVTDIMWKRNYVYFLVYVYVLEETMSVLLCINCLTFRPFIHFFWCCSCINTRKKYDASWNLFRKNFKKKVLAIFISVIKWLSCQELQGAPKWIWFSNWVTLSFVCLLQWFSNFFKWRHTF